MNLLHKNNIMDLKESGFTLALPPTNIDFSLFESAIDKDFIGYYIFKRDIPEIVETFEIGLFRDEEIPKNLLRMKIVNTEIACKINLEVTTDGCINNLEQAKESARYGMTKHYVLKNYQNHPYLIFTAAHFNIDFTKFIFIKDCLKDTENEYCNYAFIYKTNIENLPKLNDEILK